MCDLFEEFDCEHNKLADNLYEVIPFSISDNSTGSEERQFTNKKRIKSRDDINENSLEEQKDVELFESSKDIELNEEEEKDKSEKTPTYINKIKKSNKNTDINNFISRYSNERADLLTGQSKKVSKFTKNVSFVSENDKLKLLEKQNLPLNTKNKTNPKGNVLITLNGETNSHTGDPDSPNDSKKNTQNNPEIPEKKVLGNGLGILVSENKTLNTKIKKENKKIDNKSKDFLESKKEVLEEIILEKSQNDSLQNEEDLEDKYDDNYDPQSILPSHSNEFNNNDELLNVSFSNVESNKKQYNHETNHDDDCENKTNLLIL